jgi:phosphopantothenoylcysteine synthetase/decarboxylase
MQSNTHSHPFIDKRFLITSGPMRAPIDAIRYMANTSTGKLGSLLALEALRRGAQVTFIFGEGSAQPQPAELGIDHKTRLKTRQVTTYDDLMKLFGQELSGGKYDVVLHAMAVLDYVPKKSTTAKTPSGKDHWTIELVPTPKLIQMVKRWDPEVLLVGFKLEVGGGREELVRAARLSAEKSGADLVVANELGTLNRGEHQALIVDARGRVAAELDGKEKIAQGLMELIANKIRGER